MACAAIIMTACALCCIYIYNGTPLVAAVCGQSMEPSLHDGEYLFVWPFWGTGDVVVLDDPAGGRLLVKRVIAEGEHVVEVRGDGSVLVDGGLLDEPYADISAGDAGTYDVHEGEVFVLGDNRGGSMDSRSFQAVPGDSVRGSCLFRVLTLEQLLGGGL